MNGARPGCFRRPNVSLACFFILAMVGMHFNAVVRAEQPAATYKHGELSVSIPYASSQDGAGKLTVEILDPEDHALGKIERNVDIRSGNGTWHQTIVLAHALSFD